MNSVERFFAKTTFTGSKKTRIIRQIQRLVRAGVPLMTTLDMLWKLYSRNGRKPKEPLAQMISEWQMRLRQGKSLASSMHGWITMAEEMIIEAGEQSDKLAVALEDALKAGGAAKGIRNAILGAMIYPIFLFGAMIFMLWGFATEIAPTFATILPFEEWTGNAANMYAIASFVTEWLVIFAMAGGGAITAAMLSLPVLTGPSRKYLDKIPPWSIYKITQGASFMISMRGFIAAGIAIPDALRRMLKTGTPYFREQVSAISLRLNMGRNLGEAMVEAGNNFPDNEIAGEISIYAELNNFDDALDILAQEWISNSIDKARAASKVINNVMLVLVASTIGYIAVSMFELQQIVSEAAQR